ncbi:SOS response-associated peptidase family protein [Devosia sp. MC1541]|uniref:SOS response-associated peptidase n=1 Tax=Devosia sp. MC1541 TaxID=2725264 RepID=UPI00145F7E18|nr:SOS response-associated peptidase family protein [Devosia sp. MC1541]
MCNLYSHTSNRSAITAMVSDLTRVHSSVGNLEPQPSIFPDYLAPIVRNTPDGRELAMARWGMPSSQFALMQNAKKRAEKLEAKGQIVDFTELLRMGPDAGTTNVRNIYDPEKDKWNRHWGRWMGVENRCLVPFTSFSEYDSRAGADGKKLGDTWFALDQSRPLAFFAGIWLEGWNGVRKAKTGIEEGIDLFAFLTCTPNDVVGAIHPKAMPVILTDPDEIEMWLTGPKELAIGLQRPLPDGALEIVAVGKKSDP